MKELEIRGPLLSHGSSQKFIEFLEKESEKMEKYNEVAIFFNTEKIVNFGNFESGKARIQANQKVWEDDRIIQVVKMKIGSPSADERKEYEMQFSKPGLKAFIKMMERFGVNEGSFRSCKRYDYGFDDFEVSLKFDHPVGDHYEVEYIDTGKNSSGSKEKLIRFIKKFNLTFWKPEEYKSIILNSRDKAPNISCEKGVREFSIR